MICQNYLNFLEPIQLDSQLLKVNELEDYPEFIEELPENREECFLDVAKSLGEKFLV